MTNAKSVAAAQQLGDIFARLQWHRRGIYATAGSNPSTVAIQYKSEQFGCCRVVVCDALALMRWLKENATKQGVWVRLLSILDKKTELHASVRQELLPLDSLDPAPRRALMPD